MLLRASVVRSLLLCALFMSALGSEVCGTKDGLNLLKTIKERAVVPKLDEEMLLYTPTLQHYETCPSNTLRCMSSEMEMLLDEWTMDNKRNKKINKLKKIVDIIRAQIPKNQPENQASGCVSCEHFPERPVPTFVEALNVTLQLINSKCQSAT